MDSETYIDQNQKKKKNRPVPLIFWLGGALITGGLITFAILNFRKSDQLKTLAQRLTETENTLTSEKNELSGKLRQSEDSYHALATEHEAVVASLASEQARNNSLAASNASYVNRENKLKEEIRFLKDSTGGLKSQILALQSEADNLRGMVSDLQTQYNQSKQLQSDQESVIQNQREVIRADSLAMANFLDSLRRENVAGYFNNTFITGAYGLRDRAADYTHHFIGFSTVNGYVINKHFMTGIGIGLYGYNGGGFMMPLFVDLKYHFGRRNFTPYIFADGGLLIDLNNTQLSKPSLFVNPGIGIDKKLGRHFSVNLGAGYFLQKDNVRNSFINAQLGLIYRRK